LIIPLSVERPNKLPETKYRIGFNRNLGQRLRTGFGIAVNVQMQHPVRQVISRNIGYAFHDRFDGAAPFIAHRVAGRINPGQMSPTSPMMILTWSAVMGPWNRQGVEAAQGATLIRRLAESCQTSGYRLFHAAHDQARRTIKLLALRSQRAGDAGGPIPNQLAHLTGATNGIARPAFVTTAGVKVVVTLRFPRAK
jgi:hypothetical protein